MTQQPERRCRASGFEGDAVSILTIGLLREMRCQRMVAGLTEERRFLGGGFQRQDIHLPKKIPVAMAASIAARLHCG